MTLIYIKDTNGNTRPKDASWVSESGKIAVHLQKGYAIYAITHIPTGCRIASMYIRGEAIMFAEQIANEINWDFQGLPPDPIKQKYHELMFSSGFEFS
jgi:hypothetical protein